MLGSKKFYLNKLKEWLGFESQPFLIYGLTKEVIERIPFEQLSPLPYGHNRHTIGQWQLLP